MRPVLFIALAFYCTIASAQPFLIEEEFNAAPTPPASWTFTSIASYAPASDCGKSAPALRFDASGDQALSPTWVNGDQITFMLRATSTPVAGDNMLVEVYNGSVWSTLANVKPHTTSKVTTLSIATNITRARFTYTKVSANTSFDDFTVRQAGQCTGAGVKITFINVDACGSACEGRDEFFTFRTGSTALSLPNLEFSYPDANLFSVTWCGTSANMPCDNYIATNAAAVAALNTLAGCTIFTSAPASIPANSNVIVFNGDPQNTPTNFSALCGGGITFYALFANNTSDCNGRFGNYSTGGDSYRGFFLRDRGTGCTDTAYYYKDNVGLSDGAGNSVNGSSVSYIGVPYPHYIQTACTFTVLPITLVSFNATAGGSDVDLRWATASEENSARFEVERSADDIAFKSIGTLPAAGQSQTHIEYALDDPAPFGGVSYYRLREIDSDGSSTLSDVVAVFFDGAHFHGITMEGDGEDITAVHNMPVGSGYEVLDASGRAIISGATSDEHRLRLSASRLDHGMYVLHMSDGQRAATASFVR